MSAFFVPEEKAPSGRQSRFGEDVVDVSMPSKRSYLLHDIMQGGPRLKACGMTNYNPVIQLKIRLKNFHNVCLVLCLIYTKIFLIFKGTLALR